MIRVSIKGAKELSAKLDKAAKKDLRESIMSGVEAGARRAEQHLKEVELRGGSLNVRSGHLRNSVHTRLDRKEMSARVGTTVRYAAIHETGGTIRPKNAKVLAVPLKKARKFTHAKAGRSRGGPLEYKGFWSPKWLMKKKGWRHPIFFGDVGGGEMVPLFIGLLKVKLKARRAFGKTTKAVNAGVVRVINDSIKRGLP